MTIRVRIRRSRPAGPAAKSPISRPPAAVAGRAIPRVMVALLLAAGLAGLLMTGGIGAWSLLEARADPAKPVPVLTDRPLVRVVAAKERRINVVVHSEGVVMPRAESRIAAETAGRVIEVSPNLVAGGFVKEGEPLLKLDARDYALSMARAEIALEQARLQLETEEQQAAVARKEWELVGEGEPSALALRLPQLANARAAIRAAEAAVQQATLEMERTTVTAPFSGRVRSADVGLGQFVQRGSPVASIYAVDVAHVRLPIPDPDLAFVNLPLGVAPAGGPQVSLVVDFAGKEHRAAGRIVRTEGEVDASTGVVHAIAEIRDPYGVTERRGGAPFMVGMYVQAQIYGRTIQAIEIPARALRESSTVMIVDGDDRVDFRQVEIIRAEGDSVLVQGLGDGDRVCVAAPDPLVNGMRVRVEEPTASDAHGS